VIDLAAVTRTLSPKQIRSIVESAQVRIAIWAGAVRSGKTIASLLAFLIALAAAPEQGLVLICGKTLQSIERNIIEPLQDKALFGPLAAQVHHTRGANTAVILGRTVWLIGANDAKAEGKIQGLTACLAYVDEATLMPQGFWTMLLGRLSVPGARLLATTNPNGPAHWLRKDYILRTGELNLAHWHFTLDDNPALDPDYVASLRAEYVGLWHRRYILGEWCLAEGAVYDMWDPERHVVTDAQMPRIDRWIGVGVDYGTTNPFAALLLGLGAPEHDGRQRLYLAREWRHDSRLARRSLTDVEYSQKVRTWLTTMPIPDTDLRGVQPEYLVIDPSAASFRQQMYRDGWPSTPANNNVLDRIRLTSSLLAADALRVHESCTGLINEFPGYSWDPDLAEKGEDAPIKADDHSLDGEGYIVLTTQAAWRPYVPLEIAA
jgi:PBSX family phage terminase large subunit